MSKVINLNVLSENSINKAIKQLENYQKQLEKKTVRFAKKLAQEGVKIAKMQIKSMDAVGFTQDLINSIMFTGESDGDKAVFYIMATSDHAVFVEFGTGYEGRYYSYIGEIPSEYEWKYVSGSQIVANASKGIYGWFYKKGDRVYFTSGMASRPFMWNTAMELHTNVERIAKEVFGSGK